MIDYFVPISLLVLGGFALGLAVGVLAWGPASRRLIRDTATSPKSPAWQAKQVRSRHRSPAPGTSRIRT